MTAILNSDNVKLTRIPSERYPLAKEKSVSYLSALKLPRIPVKHTHKSKNRARAKKNASERLKAFRYTSKTLFNTATSKTVGAE